MATADQVRALIQSHTEGDETRFYSVALQVAAQEARIGHARFAQDLRELVDRAKSKAPVRQAGALPRPVPVVQPRGDLAGLLSASYPRTRLVDMGLAEASHASLERVLLEQRERAQLRTHGFSPLRKLLLLGPPGTGKTMTGGVLASELSLPLFAIQLDGLITKFMGETASKLRLIFDAIEQTRAVYLFDEFDALGSQRGLSNEVGEIRRVLNSFLQFLDQDESDSLIVAATNHAELLDRALYRRFDIVIEYDLPTPDVAERVMRNKLALLSTDGVDWAEATRAAGKLSHGDLARACEQAAKDAILTHSMSITTGGLAAALQARVRASR